MLWITLVTPLFLQEIRILSGYEFNVTTVRKRAMEV
jgi:hypothetical protein